MIHVILLKRQVYHQSTKIYCELRYPDKISFGKNKFCTHLTVPKTLSFYLKFASAHMMFCRLNTVDE